MKFLIVPMILVGVAYAQNNIFTMGNFSMSDDSIRVKLDDLRYALDNITPAMKEQLQSLLASLGINIYDFEQALNNPSEEVQEIFGPSGMSISDMKTVVDNLPQSIKQIFENKMEL